MKIAYQRLYPDVVPPKKKHPSDAGWDVTSRERKVLRPGETYIFDTGLVLALLVPDEIRERWAGMGMSWYLRAADKSGLAGKRGIHVLGGVVDREYRGELRIVLGNFGFIRDGSLAAREVEFTPGSELCQMVPELIVDVQEEALEVSGFEATDRGAAGFGSG